MAEPYQFIDSWGFPRMTGTEYQHGHQGTDIMAPFGTELYAVERGVVIRVGTDVLGGTKLWVKGQSGTYYYYAHLQSYEDGVTEGTPVEAGDVVGYVGDTGNARGGAPHLHFQVHPGGGDPVNPYGLLRVVSDLSRR
ncbi:MAG: M23 family metallopeptidase [Acidimicrobiales bacterium]|nr:M23 family metallopeptidase [Acidimicrobiales bacterium]